MSKQRNIVAYPAIFEPSDVTKDRFTITFPDVPDAISQGDGFTQSLAMAAEVLELSLYDVDELPEVSPLVDIEKPSDSSIILCISIDLERAAEDVLVP
ncbi:type II toxin-antitoxin system HicB family antitoxin [Enterococcus sp. 669A]|uniref:Type II toxin-antitoxin system HicB family antitoxin n=1 Tax=Candidatus Enterococcus moelleringii TaxID=2815325 RepID=A0ABS3L7D9_9ENTE|nr:type II toxin-antitoxin system HicB family antitoxin [Enterococcus sp. 669A]MBO1305545.1 type II toxin-antitoxin system HicB family antitoxin [Enterococcus sp. 669A]